uniref:UDENN domain-containing protein n=1 Tax=Lygus hesperus TaxID=30085 RepID=A0A0A9XSC0_LYGHE
MECCKKGPILHVLVIGFHHKKGCQVEYSYPPLVTGNSSDNHDPPPGWKYLPTLALPDGSHNYDKDTVFFHLPSLESPDETVFGISCFRQIPVEKLKVRTPDMTRGTVQKAVCVLSTVPLYGQIQVKMELITHAYFDEGDFTKVNLLEDTYTHLNACIKQMEDLHSSSQLFVGLSARDLILTLRHKVLQLYKLLLLEKKVLFFQSPVQPLCSSVLALLSLHPGMIEMGLSQSACFKPSRPMSPIPQFASCPPSTTRDSDIASNGMTGQVDNSSEYFQENGLTTENACRNMLIVSPSESLPSSNIEVKETEGKPDGSVTKDGIITVGHEAKETSPSPPNPQKFNGATTSMEDAEICNGSCELNGQGDALPVREYGSSLSRDPSMDLLAGEASYQAAMTALANIEFESCALPMSLFAEGYLWLPYLSLPYMDVLTDPNIKGYILGATNVLFKQKKNIADVIIELESRIIETSDPELKKMLHLSTEDLRFGEYLDRRTRSSDDAYTDGVPWEGGDEWIRSQFHAYTLALLRTSLLPDGSKEFDQFNRSYMTAFMETSSYKRWREHPDHRNVLEAAPGHPFAGQLSVADVKLRLAHTMQTTEGGRKLIEATSSTGRAVGGAIIQARGALSNWWSNLTTPPPTIVTGTDALQEEPPAEGNRTRSEPVDVRAAENPALSKSNKPVEQAIDALSETVGGTILQV